MNEELEDLPDLALPSRAEQRQLDRLPSGYKPMSVAGMTFDPRMTFELALAAVGGEPTGQVFLKYGYDNESATKLIANNVFQQVLKAYVDDVKEHGITYRAKARLIAEDLLTHAYEIATDPEAPTNVRADLIKWTAKVADYEPKQNAPQAGAGNGFALQIVFSGEAKKEPMLVQGQTIEQRADDE